MQELFKVTFFFKIILKMGRDYSSVAQHLAGNCEVASSIPSTKEKVMIIIIILKITFWEVPPNKKCIVFSCLDISSVPVLRRSYSQNYYVKNKIFQQPRIGILIQKRGLKDHLAQIYLQNTCNPYGVWVIQSRGSAHFL